MPLFLRYLFNVIFTSTVFYAADWSMYQRMLWWQDLLIALSIILVAAAVAYARMPLFLMIVAQFPLSIMIMLSFFAWDWQAWVNTYVLALIYYTLLHVFLSGVLRYDSLLPGWIVREMFQNQEQKAG